MEIEELTTALDERDEAIQKKMNGLENENGELRDRIELMEANRDRPRGGVESQVEYKNFNEFCRTGIESKEMSIVGGAAAGDALVPELIANTIISRALAQSRLSSIVRRTTSDTSDYVRLLNMRGQAAAWISETGSRADTASMQFREIRPTHGELYSSVVVTNWLLNDAKFDVGAMIMENATAQFAKSIEAAIYNGSGTNRPTGFANTTASVTGDDASPERGADVVEAIVTTGDNANDIVDLFFALKPEYRANASFLMSSTVLATIRKLRDSSGSGFLWQQNLSNAIDAPDGLLVGRPVYTSESLPSIGGSPQADGIYVGDFQQAYELVQIGGMSVLRDPFSTHGKTTFYLAQRFGGRLIDNDSLKVLRA